MDEPRAQAQPESGSGVTGPTQASKMREHQKPKAKTGPSVEDLQKAVNNVMPREFATLLQEGGTGGRTATNPSVQRLARAISRIFPQAQDIVAQGISEQLGYQFIPTEDETRMLKQFLSEWLQEQMSARRQKHKVEAAGATAGLDATGGSWPNDS
ncbi:hypothetical protein QBC45DRAFT_396139 [Copromyces sp. CBS 386.78]|nr:hypothetical protein QBC45DRAFT_396139 [Copromyces sp. CBS 386.78]